MINKIRSISEIKALLLQVNDVNDENLLQFKEDERKGVQILIQQTLKRIEKKVMDIQQHNERLIYEKQLRQMGYQIIAGIDEVGRGPLAGPVVTAAVILPENCDSLMGVNDSKQLSPIRRKKFVEQIKEIALCYEITVTPVDVIDTVNIYEATRMSMLQSVNGLNIQPDYLLLDAMKIDSILPQQSLIKGDAKSLSIAAASILAKEHRDQLMREYSKQYPEFGFDKHMGYGTKQHLQALAKYGVTPIHRRSFSPVMQTKKIYNQD